ncbi:hypothetical protein DXA30_02820 [Fusobacterium ulcerans]|uniref:hypothetical protein n=1 Tax=Fusobacterium ulcerans TaxID=861 RepID=UPI000E4AAE5D|nr:hypothetical protein [Fusobacterium ulcerans]RGY66703.1 hypothetical protein DXA30_02820 [Fusobacterium ulcerans]
MKGLKIMQAANFNCVFGEEKNVPMLKEFKRIIFPAFKTGKKEYSKSIIKKFFFNDIKIFDTNLGYCLYGKIIKDIDLLIKSKLDKDGNLIEADDKVPSAPYSEFILILKNHRMLFTPSQQGSPTLRDFKNLISHSIKNTIRMNDIRENKRILKFKLNIFVIPEEITLKNKLDKFEKIEFFKFEIQPQNSRLFDNEYIRKLEVERKGLGADKIEQKIVKPSHLNRIKEIVLKFKDMAYYTLKGKEKDKDWEVIENSTYKKEIEYFFHEGNSNDENIKIAVNAAASQDKRIVEVDNHNTLVYNEVLNDIESLK